MTLGLAMVLSACSGGGGSSSSSFSIQSCSLGCAGSSGVNQFSCSITDVFVNQEIRVTFSQELDIRTINNNTVQIVELDTGKTPPGTFSLDPSDKRILIYRPTITFDSSGNPIFGLSANKSYSLRIPGTDLDPLGPYVANMTGQANTSRLQCTLVASRGVFDSSPGAPRLTMTVDVVTARDMNGTPIGFAEALAQGAVEVFRDTEVRLVFDDIMNPGSLVNPVTGVSDTIRVTIDPDGDTSDLSDQVPLDGTFTITLDQDALITTVVFEPSGGLPSAGSDPMVQRKVVVSLEPTIADLGGNGVAGSLNFIFTPEVVPFSTETVVESFDEIENEDGARTGSAWTNGFLATGPGGGSGRLGDLTIPSGEVIVLRTGGAAGPRGLQRDHRSHDLQSEQRHRPADGARDRRRDLRVRPAARRRGRRAALRGRQPSAPVRPRRGDRAGRDRRVRRERAHP